MYSRRGHEETKEGDRQKAGREKTEDEKTSGRNEVGRKGAHRSPSTRAPSATGRAKVRTPHPPRRERRAARGPLTMPRPPKFRLRDLGTKRSRCTKREKGLRRTRRAPPVIHHHGAARGRAKLRGERCPSAACRDDVASDPHSQTRRPYTLGPPPLKRVWGHDPLKRVAPTRNAVARLPESVAPRRTDPLRSEPHRTRARWYALESDETGAAHAMAGARDRRRVPVA